MQVLASGRSASVYALDEERVLRRDLRGRDMAAFSELLRVLRDQGVPVPAVYEVTGPDVVMERVHGDSLLTGIHDSESLEEAADIIGRLHRTLDLVVPPAGLAALAGAGLARAGLPGADLPGADSAGDSLVHLDLHPGNVILGPDGPVLIDWENAARAPRAVDVAMSIIILGQAPELDAIALPADRRDAIAALVAAAGAEPSAEARSTAARLRMRDTNLTGLERRRVRASGP